MRLVTFTEAGQTRIGLLKEDYIIDLSQVVPSLPTDMLSFLGLGDTALQTARQQMSATPHYSIKDVFLEAPIRRPPKILAIGLNYRAHALESNMEIPKHPMVFTKQRTSANGPYDPIYSPDETNLLDYEGELAVVIGKQCRRVKIDGLRRVFRRLR